MKTILALGCRRPATVALGLVTCAMLAATAATADEPGAASDRAQARSVVPPGFAGTPPFLPNRDMVYLIADYEQQFQRLDANRDADIDADEAAAEPRLARDFVRLDVWPNARLSRSEFAAFESAGPSELAAD